ncbi:MAG TPA: glycosyl hydrolase 115 family protein [Tepidisphaeraceae bacterium]|jgi:hypothetical protein|nr:glycosyl hydrolase 115 family protein [Tepidisphaeraceae bacterium]
MLLRKCLCVMVVLLLPALARAQQWTGQVRGSWVRDGAAAEGDVTLAKPAEICDIVVGAQEESPVQQAAKFLAGDLEKITGQKPAIVAAAREGHAAIVLNTAPDGSHDFSKWNYSFQPGDWEAYQIRTFQNEIMLTGSDARGTAYAAYTLSERLGIDPLYLWTGYVPVKHETLVMKGTDFSAGPPTFRFRGFFHDDEDILPRPFEPSGYPYRLGDVPTEWYAKYFETALRLRMNMVAPYTRVHRRYEVQKMASDWGLFYTSHHYDILLSNPFGIERYDLGEKRNAGKIWDWDTNRQGMMNFWRGGVEENKDLDCVWPVGLRGTDDHSYTFPKRTPADVRLKTFRDVINDQVEMVKSLLPKGKPAYFHFTMYAEMLDQYLKDPAGFALPADVTIVWPDDQDGRIRYLPTDRGKWKHGVYYHLAYLGPVPKQSAHIVTPAMIAQEFKKIVDAQATDYMLVNVSEMREFVMEGRMLAEVCWDAKTALADMPAEARPAEPLANFPSKQAATQPTSNPAGDRYVNWWCNEYFGADAAPLAAEAYHRYYTLLCSYDKQWFGSGQVQSLIDQLQKRFAGQKVASTDQKLVAEMKDRDQKFREAFDVIGQARDHMTRAQQQFFFDHLELPLLIDWRPTQAAIELAGAVDARDDAGAWQACDRAMKPLEQLEVEIARAEHPPFELWYRKTWIRRENADLNVHRPYEQLRAFLSSGGRDKLKEPDNARRPVFPVRKD